MSKESQKWAAAALGFAAAVMWTTVGFEAALTCLLAAGLCVGAMIAREGGLVGRLTGAAAETRRRVQAAIPAPAPRTVQAKARRTPEPAPPRPKATPSPSPVAPPYDRDVASGEHVYEVANYGW